MWDRAMDGEAGTTVADRSTAAVGVANEGGEGSPAVQQGGATSDGGTTDDQTSGSGPVGAGDGQEDKPEDRPEGAREDEGAGSDTDDEAGTPEKAGEPEKTGTAEKTGSGTGGSGKATPGDPEATEPMASLDAFDTLEEPAVTAKPAVDEKPGTAAKPGTATKPGATEKPAAAAKAAVRELHSGHKLARRYQLEECVTRVDGFSSWRAVDEKLRRAVGIHILPADHERSRAVLAAARSAALLGDPRFVQVLDAVEENDLVYVIHEWLPDAVSLADLLAAGPLEPHEAYQMVSQVSQGMSAAHREGLAHLRLDPGAVLRTVSGQYRIRGLAVAAALRGLSSERPQRQDTEAIGALLYASLTQRWPYEEDAHGLTGLPKGVGLVAPDQVRAGVHRGLSEVAIRALVNDGATASREEPPCTTPEELAKAVAAVPRIRPPEQAPPVYQPTAFQPPPPQPRGATRAPAPVPAPPPALPGRTGRALKWAVSALVIVAIGLGSWQLADALKSREDQSTKTPPTTGQKAGGNPTQSAAPQPITIADAKEFSLDGAFQNSDNVGTTYDKDPSTYWRTKSYHGGPTLAPYKPGVGVIYDLGSRQTVRSAELDVLYPGDHTSVTLYAASSFSTSTPLSQMTKLGSAESTSNTIRISVKAPQATRYVVVWFTALPHSDADQYSDAGYKQGLEEVSFAG
jgi:serine/threonine protein kinase